MKTNFRLKDYVFFVLVVLGLLLMLTQKLFFPEKESESGLKLGTIRIAERSFKVEVSTTSEQKYLGLGGRENLNDGWGMLFVHEKAGRYSYVMRGMKFDLDFIFIRDGKVVDLAKNVAREYQGTITGADDYELVLELDAGSIKAAGIQIGDRVEVEYE